VRNDAASEARNTAHPASSSGRPQRFIGVRRFTHETNSALSRSARFISVAM